MNKEPMSEEAKIAQIDQAKRQAEELARPIIRRMNDAANAIPCNTNGATKAVKKNGAMSYLRK